MKKLILLFFICFSNFLFSQSKRDSVDVKQINLLNANYKDFVTVDKMVYAISNGDSLIAIDLQKSDIKLLQKDITALSKTSRGELIIADKNGSIFKRNEKGKISRIDQTQAKVNNILIGNKDEYVVITNKSIYYKKQHFIPKTRNILQAKMGIKEKGEILSAPDFTYLDKENRIWLTYDNGEFGEKVCFFDLKTKEFYSEEYLSVDVEYNDPAEFQNEHFKKLLKNYPDKVKVVQKDTVYKFPYNLPIHYPVKGMAENNEGEIFIPQSLMHFSVNSHFSIIKKFTNEGFYQTSNITKVLSFESFSDTIEGKVYKSSFVKEYLGPITYNKLDKSIYYYTDKGFFQLIKKDNAYKSKFVFKPLIYWTATNKNKIGYDINVTKFEFISEKEMVFLTSNNGIGYFNGKKVKYFK